MSGAGPTRTSATRRLVTLMMQSAPRRRRSRRPRRSHERTYGNANRSSARAFAGGREGPQQRDRRGAILLRGRKRRAGSCVKSRRGSSPTRGIENQPCRARASFFFIHWRERRPGDVDHQQRDPLAPAPARFSDFVLADPDWGRTLELGRSGRRPLSYGVHRQRAASKTSRVGPALGFSRRILARARGAPSRRRRSAERPAIGPSRGNNRKQGGC